MDGAGGLYGRRRRPVWTETMSLYGIVNASDRLATVPLQDWQCPTTTCSSPAAPALRNSLLFIVRPTPPPCRRRAADGIQGESSRGTGLQGAGSASRRRSPGTWIGMGRHLNCGGDFGAERRCFGELSKKQDDDMDNLKVWGQSPSPHAGRGADVGV